MSAQSASIRMNLFSRLQRFCIQIVNLCIFMILAFSLVACGVCIVVFCIKHQDVFSIIEILPWSVWLSIWNDLQSRCRILYTIPRTSAILHKLVSIHRNPSIFNHWLPTLCIALFNRHIPDFLHRKYTGLLPDRGIFFISLRELSFSDYACCSRHRCLPESFIRFTQECCIILSHSNTQKTARHPADRFSCFN